ncbi:AfsR/SARP family transcriptional regulator [Streptoalloteichus tenebrarius]|uniref:AfsR/SARP family transcriptional regulator n=1 Tax=Streptoalloteichus tenebrarius (strain ATCC 17920 / DSM 40477 / JCM 4838 / CBS 697.72 / NBRC 16177 / NCIMB 11028 / NRRL B-12390 / A12253. 1 / ISP 5477) TaxID=1933 RepID=UPI0020A27EB4|nr:transcriptional regulator [Streptoalloteichus tenebrarius]
MLGPLEVVDDSEEPCRPGRHKQRVLLAMLLLRANTPVKPETMVDWLWGEQPPTSARANLQTYVSGLRQLLHSESMPGHARLSWRHGAYRLLVAQGELDSHTFESLADQGRRALAEGRADSAHRLLAHALAHWRGEVLEDVVLPEQGRVAATRLHELRLAAQEADIEARLALGQHVAVIPELQVLVRRHPLREGLWGGLMRALYGAGRQAEALETYHQLRGLVADELGVEPCQSLRRLHHQILTGDPALLPRPVVAVGPALPRPHQLPAGITDFTGRVEQLGELDGLGFGHQTGTPPSMPILAITGMAGVGKTALALRWAHQAAARYPDGQLYVDLNGRDGQAATHPAEALRGFLRALGVPSRGLPRQVEDLAALFRSSIAGQRVLVMLDDAADTHQLRPLLPGAAGCLVVITSRNRLSGLVSQHGARRLLLSPFLPCESLALMTRLLGEDRVGAEWEAAATLARLCGHVPLAVRAAATRLADHPGRGLASMVAQLHRDGLDALEVERDGRTGVGAALAASYGRLRPHARRLLRALATLARPDFGLSTAAEVADITLAAARDLLDQLMALNLVHQRRTGRFVLNNLVRLFVRTCAQHEDVSVPVPAARSSGPFSRTSRWDSTPERLVESVR